MAGPEKNKGIGEKEIMLDYEKLGREALAELRAAADRAPEVQEKLLLELLKENQDTPFGRHYGFSGIHSMEDYRKRVPLTTFDDYDPYWVNGGLSAEPVEYYALSSGTSGSAKYIPTTRHMRNNYFRTAFCVPLGMVNEYYPGCTMEELHGMIFQTGEFRCAEFKNGIMCGIRSSAVYLQMNRDGGFDASNYTAPKEVLFQKDKADLIYAKARFALMHADVTAIHSVFVHRVVGIMKYIVDYWDVLLDDIEHGTVSEELLPDETWRARILGMVQPMPERAAELRALDRAQLEDHLIQKLWPKIKYMILIVGESFSQYGEQFARFRGDVPVHGFVYGSSEGTIGVGEGVNRLDCYIPNPEDCIFEFVPVDQKEAEEMPVKGVGEVIAGHKYELVITNCGGLYRYQMQDVVKILEFYGKMPVIRFCYRRNLIMNLAGEKTNLEQLKGAVRELELQGGVHLTEYAVSGDLSVNPGRYVLYYETAGNKKPKWDDQAFDRCMRENSVDYNDCRNTMEIGPAVTRRLKPDSFTAWKDRLAENGAEMGQDKPMNMLDTPEKQNFFAERTEEEERDETGEENTQ